MPQQRGGYVLVVFVLLVSGLLALAALVIDLGFARLAQRQMQSAVETAAVEAVRGRDSLTESERRAIARELVALSFDDDLDGTNGDPRQFGAGPVLDFSGGVPLATEFNASQLVTLPETRVHKPSLELNESNEPHGDIVFGTFAAGPASEDRAYAREDFQATGDTAALVRLRRTSGDNPLDEQAGVSSRSPTVPYLFGRGSLLHLDSRGRGITVRGTAIAGAQPARTVGAAHPPELYAAIAGLPGAAPFLLEESSFWDGLTTQTVAVAADGSFDGGQLIGLTALTNAVADSASTLNVASNRGIPGEVPFRIRIDGELLEIVAIAGTQWTAVRGTDGTLPAAHTAGSIVTQHRALAVGDELTDAASDLPGEMELFTGAEFHQLVAIVDEVANAGQRVVVAFGRVEWSWTPPNSLTLTKRAGPVVSENASAQWLRDLPSVFRDDPQPDPELEQLLELHRLVSDGVSAPALVR